MISLHMALLWHLPYGKIDLHSKAQMKFIYFFFFFFFAWRSSTEMDERKIRYCFFFFIFSTFFLFLFLMKYVKYFHFTWSTTSCSNYKWKWCKMFFSLYKNFVFVSLIILQQKNWMGCTQLKLSVNCFLYTLFATFLAFFLRLRLHLRSFGCRKEKFI